MNQLDKLCAGLAFLAGVVFLLLGAVGLFVGSSAHFALPPVLGGIPAIIGWGIVRSVTIAWKAPQPQQSYPESLLSAQDETGR